jgi:hypothetical protein
METVMSDNKNLVVGVQQHLTTQVKTANIQLLISSQLTQDIERRRFVEILKSFDSFKVVEFFYNYSYLNAELIEKYQAIWGHKYIYRFYDYDHDKDIIYDLIELGWAWLYEDSEFYERNSFYTIEEYKDELCGYGYYGLSENKTLPWTLALIQKHEDKWNWYGLSENDALPWSLALIEKFKDKWNWELLSRNDALPWSLALIEKFKDKWDWEWLSRNEELPWSLALIEKYEDKWDWSWLSHNEALPWSLELIEKYEDKWDWRGQLMSYDSLSKNKALPWSLELIEKFEDKWDWFTLSKNEGIALDISLNRKV